MSFKIASPLLTKSFSNQLCVSCTLANRSSQIKNLRFFGYDHWYKAEEERNKKLIKHNEELLKGKSFFEIISFFAKQGAVEFKKLLDECKESSDDDYRIGLKHRDFEYLFRFNTKDDIEQWRSSSDSGYKIGKSKAYFNLTQQNTGLFHGYLSNEFDKPEKMRAIYTGYVNIQSKNLYKSFYRTKRFNLTDYTHFVIKLRGDGRNYMLTLNTPFHFTLTHTYMHMYPIYTRGGPYWQHVKIPFSKFFHVTHGRVSDKQYRFMPVDVRNLGITCMDGVEGQFQLELDFIGVVRDIENYEEFAYEKYQIPKYISNT